MQWSLNGENDSIWTMEGVNIQEFLPLEDNATDWCLNRDMSRPTGFVFLGLES